MVDVQPNRILLVTIHHMLYPITVDVLHQVFSPYGFVEKLVTFQKSAGQLLRISFLSISLSNIRFSLENYLKVCLFHVIGLFKIILLLKLCICHLTV